ncbi:MAG: RsmE family RNA methyltransferase [bacterium]
MIIETLPKHKVAIFSEIKSDNNQQDTYWIHKEVFNYLKNSLRLKPKDNLIIFDSFNYLNYCRYVFAEFVDFIYTKKDYFIKTNLLEIKDFKLNNVIINLYIVPPKNRYFNDLLANVVQLPLDTIYFFPSEYMVVNISDLYKKIERINDILFWNTIYVSKYYPIKIKVISTFREFLEDLKFYNWVIVFHPYTNLSVSGFFKLNEIYSIFSDPIKKQRLIQDIKEEKFRVCIIIGPEGGFSNNEINTFRNYNAYVLRFDYIENIVKTELSANIGISQFLSLFNYLIN